MTEPMNAADVPDEIFLAYHDAESACWGHPDHGLRYAQCCRLAGLAAALPLYAEQLGAKLSTVTFPCPNHKPPQHDVRCVPCQRYTALLGARRVIDGRDWAAEAVRAHRADAKPAFLITTDDTLSQADVKQLRADIQITARPTKPSGPLCEAQIPAATAKNLGADPATTCARIPDHFGFGHLDAAGDVMWIDPQPSPTEDAT